MYKVQNVFLEYIGETKRNLESHLKEHQVATRRAETEKSALEEHAWAKQHCPSWDEIKAWTRLETTIHS